MDGLYRHALQPLRRFGSNMRGFPQFSLQYAARAKRIKTNAVVNEDINNKIIRELRAEIEKLRQQVAGQGNDEVEELRRQVRLGFRFRV